jgi:hypothetical protein
VTTTTQVLDVARSKLGTVESPPNSNHQMFGVWYGFDRQPWCAMFVSWCMAMAGAASQYRFAAVAYAVDAARKQGRLTTTFKTGYVACRLADGDWGPGHTGIVEAVHSDGTVTTIEGNTSIGTSGSQRDGGGVWRRRRAKSFWNKGCIRIDYSPALPTIDQGDDDMKPRLVRAPSGAVYAFDGVALRPANNPVYQSVIRWYSGQAEVWDNWSQEQIDVFPKEAGTPE